MAALGNTEDPDAVRPEPAELDTVFEQKSEGTWACNYHDVSSLWLIRKYRHHPLTGSFHTFDTFHEHARQGTLPAASWLDPHYAVKTLKGNDDHPPSDIRQGQKLVAEVYNTLLKSPVWDKTMLVITYDEHGGFYDHVVPPQAADDFPNLTRYGVRVPTIIVSPWVAAGSASHTVFDHTSIIKTILLRFCRQPDGSIPSMSARSDAAADLGDLLTEDKPRTCEPIQHALIEPGFQLHERGEPHEDWLLRRLMGGVHRHVQEIVSG